LHEYKLPDDLPGYSEFISRRAEELSVAQFVELTKLIILHGQHAH
jgi:hypothetical protein